MLQDVLFVHPLTIGTLQQSMLYMVCDGHSGVEAANFVASNFLRMLQPKLPARLPNFNVIKGEFQGCAFGVGWDGAGQNSASLYCHPSSLTL